MGFGVCEGLHWLGNACGLQMDGFSAHFEPSESIFDDFYEFGDFAFISDGLNKLQCVFEAESEPISMLLQRSRSCQSDLEA